MTQQMDMTLSNWSIMLAQESAPGAKASEPVPVGVPVSGGTAGTPTTPGTQAPTTGARPAPGGADMLWPFLVMIAIFAIMTPLMGRKERKRRQELMNSLKKQDKVLTNGGIVGTIVELSDDEVVLRVEEGRIRILRSAISQVLKPSSAPAEKPSAVGAA